MTESEKAAEKQMMILARAARRIPLEWTTWRSVTVTGMRVDTYEFDHKRKHVHHLVQFEVNIDFGFIGSVRKNGIFVYLELD